MARLTTSSAALALATALLAPVAPPLAAQSTSPASTSTATTSLSTTTSAGPAAPKRPRAISGDVATMLAQSMPKYTPPPPPPPPPTAEELAKKAEEEAADLREIDKPKNQIVRLEKYVVKEERPPIFTERQINTKKGLADLAMRRYITDADRALNRFSIPLFAAWSPGSGAGSTTQQRALFMYGEDERLKNMSDLADNTNMVMKSNAAEGSAMKREVEKTYMRTDDFGWRNSNKK